VHPRARPPRRDARSNERCASARRPHLHQRKPARVDRSCRSPAPSSSSSVGTGFAAPVQLGPAAPSAPKRPAPARLRHGRAGERMPQHNPVQRPRQSGALKLATKREVVAESTPDGARGGRSRNNARWASAAARTSGVSRVAHAPALSTEESAAGPVVRSGDGNPRGNLFAKTVDARGRVGRVAMSRASPRRPFPSP